MQGYDALEVTITRQHFQSALEIIRHVVKIFLLAPTTNYQHPVASHRGKLAAHRVGQVRRLRAVDGAVEQRLLVRQEHGDVLHHVEKCEVGALDALLRETCIQFRGLERAVSAWTQGKWNDSVPRCRRTAEAEC